MMAAMAARAGVITQDFGAFVQAVPKVIVQAVAGVPVPYRRGCGQSEAGLGVLAGTQPRHRARLDWRRQPPGDAPGACPRLHVVSDPRKPQAQLNSSRQLSLLIEGGADRSGIGLGDDEHPESLSVHTTAGKRGALPD